MTMSYFVRRAERHGWVVFRKIDLGKAYAYELLTMNLGKPSTSVIVVYSYAMSDTVAMVQTRGKDKYYPNPF